MKHISLVSLFILSSVLSLAQTQKDFEEVFARFVSCYNSNNIEKFKQLESRECRKDTRDDEFDYIRKQYGEIVSYEYIGLESDIMPGNALADAVPFAIFKVTFSKSVDGRNKYASFISLTKDDYKLCGYTLGTSSPYLDEIILNNEIILIPLHNKSSTQYSKSNMQSR